ncbi:FAD/NAD(P)-binding protein [Microbispora sp. RL4-1S]|uniref:FAD/NAD(P)-binding protein n=1 Tax=Microbispora oryzae TaxID=2806554 RepID=A0A941AKQ0_9ACTN|nr:FAD/NAD(P)-binding protein [Microbispora oryzae]MBP2705508.1 FAD/NAD(P)-binding protein [Microbispora oryzae]
MDSPERAGGSPRRIAIVGSGPRGMGVLERLAARLAENPPVGPVDIHLIDSHEVGCGRVWRSDQPDWFLMNTVSGEVTMFSGPPDDGPVRPGAGPSLAEWWATQDPACPGPNGYAPRALHGRYMRFLLDVVERTLPPGARLHRVTDLVEDLERTTDGYRLALARGGHLTVDRVVLTIGHGLPDLTGREQALAAFARERPHLRYIRGDSASEMPLDEIPAGSTVGVIGIGLSFYDVMFALTLGRNGKFLEIEPNRTVYQPSGEEPVLVAGSRSGVPLPARGRNQKSSTYSYEPTLFRPELVRRRTAHQGREPLDFGTEVQPWVIAEMELVYYATTLRTGAGEAVSAAFTAEVAARAERGVPDVRAIAAEFGAGDVTPFDLEALSRPFDRATFSSPEEFHAALIREMHHDLDRAERGNYDDPLKAALDVMRDTRWVIRELVDFGGLHPRSHRTDFLEWFSPRSSFLAAGPPRIRVRHALALIECGLLRVTGPNARFVCDEESGMFAVSSPNVAGSRTELDVVIDARVPNPNMPRDPSRLVRRLHGRGVWTEFVNGEGPDAFATGGVAITRSPFHPIGRDGVPDTGVYVLGIPAEHTRWFTLVGSGRPGPWNEFIRDADAIAAHALTP